MCVCACSLCLFSVCVCVSFEGFRPLAVDKRLCAGGGSQLAASCYIIAAFSCSEPNIIESWYYNKERLVLHCVRVVHACICVYVFPAIHNAAVKKWSLLFNAELVKLANGQTNNKPDQLHVCRVCWVYVHMYDTITYLHLIKTLFHYLPPAGYLAMLTSIFNKLLSF